MVVVDRDHAAADALAFLHPLRALLEEGFEVAVVKDATAAAQAPGLDGYAAAVTNFRFLASAVWTTAEATQAMSGETKRTASQPGTN